MDAFALIFSIGGGVFVAIALRIAYRTGQVRERLRQQAVRALPTACGDTDLTLYFSIPNYAASGNFGGVSMAVEPFDGSVAVPCRRLDDLVADAEVGLMKVDVEGFELDALNGAEATIDRCWPLLYVENDRIEKSEALIDWIRAKDYRLWCHVPPLYNQVNYFGEAEDIKSVHSINIHCVPREQVVPEYGLHEIVSNRHPLAQE